MIAGIGLEIIRLVAFESNTSVFVFETSQVSVKLLFRRAFQDLMDQKGWDIPDIVMEEQVITLP